MIHESAYWKQPLLETAERLRSFQVAQELSEEQCAQIERDIFIGFYTVRKLIETVTKLTDATKSLKLQLFCYNSKKAATLRNNHKIDEVYEFGSQRQETRDLNFVCGRIIHSFVFAPYVGNHGELEGILFTSDTDKTKQLYRLNITDVIELFQRVGNDDPVQIAYSVDPLSGKIGTLVN